MGTEPKIAGAPPSSSPGPPLGAPGAELLEGARTVLGLAEPEMQAALQAWPRDLCLDLFTAMARLRAFDERAVILQRQGRIGTYPTFYGEEAVQAASVRALQSRDWLFPTYRQTAAVTLRGCPPLVPLLMWRGHPGGWHDVMKYRVAPLCVPVATNLPHAVGAAWGAKLRHEDLVALGYGGDGSTSAGDFHEACNLAAVVAAPVIFLITNNQWAISTPISKQTKVRRIADKAAAYGIPGIRVDAFDVFACYEAVREAAARGREGKGPTLIEAIGYRLGPHGTADEPSLYRDLELDRLWAPMEPLRRTQTAMVRAGVANDGELDLIRSDAAKDLRDIGDAIEAEPSVSIEDVAATVHRDTPWGLLPEGLREPSWNVPAEEEG
ncbi:MAG TPA: thiamine pyrophosphate-dependent enzyme [Candidatus Dormibacteraeota bacterium]|nr:thiamine pyrophosphate-dependent enzyme [Candidatus Dormibacteraeota bacterium]